MKSVAEELRGGLHPRRDPDPPPYFARPSALLADELGLVKPLPLDVQWMEARCSMDRHTSVNGLSSAIQWIERSDSMDGTRQFNGWTSTCPSGAAKRTSIPTDLCQALAEGDEVDAFV